MYIYESFNGFRFRFGINERKTTIKKIKIMHFFFISNSFKSLNLQLNLCVIVFSFIIFFNLFIVTISKFLILVLLIFNTIQLYLLILRQVVYHIVLHITRTAIPQILYLWRNLLHVLHLDLIQSIDALCLM